MKTKFIRVAQSGKTIDGREITPGDINQMAASYNPATYGARVNMEHFRSLLPDSPFRAYGDVLSLKAEDGPGGSRVLLAELDLTDDAVALLKGRQKIYWSIEITSPFPTTGGAYLAGLAMTDSPASLGTESLKFSAFRASLPEDRAKNLFAVPVEAAPDFPAAADPAPSLYEKVLSMFSKGKGTDIDKAVEAVAAEVQALKDGAVSAADFAALQASVTTLTDQLATLTETLSKTSDTPDRPQATGGPGETLTDC